MWRCMWKLLINCFSKVLGLLFDAIAIVANLIEYYIVNQYNIVNRCGRTAILLQDHQSESMKYRFHVVNHLIESR